MMMSIQKHYAYCRFSILLSLRSFARLLGCFSVAALCFLLAPLQSAKADDVITDLSSRDVPIEWNFTGTNILLFGAIEGDVKSDDPADVIIVVHGPEKTVTARQKKRVGGIWINSDPRSYISVPSFYYIAATRPLTDIAPQKTLRSLKLGFDALEYDIASRNNRLKDTQRDKYSSAIIRIMQQDGLYRGFEDGVSLLGKRLFRANISLPANVPVGEYQAKVYLFRDGRFLGVQNSPLKIQKQGFERLVYVLAFDYPFIYGVVSVILAILAGLAATAIFRRD